MRRYQAVDSRSVSVPDLSDPTWTGPGSGWLGDIPKWACYGPGRYTLTALIVVLVLNAVINTHVKYPAARRITMSMLALPIGSRFTRVSASEVSEILSDLAP